MMKSLNDVAEAFLHIWLSKTLDFPAQFDIGSLSIHDAYEVQRQVIAPADLRQAIEAAKRVDTNELLRTAAIEDPKIGDAVAAAHVQDPPLERRGVAQHVADDGPGSVVEMAVEPVFVALVPGKLLDRHAAVGRAQLPVAAAAGLTLMIAASMANSRVALTLASLSDNPSTCKAAVFPSMEQSGSRYYS